MITYTYRITGGKYHRRENGVDKVYRKNSTVELSKIEVENLRHMIEPVNPPAESQGPETEAIPSISTEQYGYLADLSAKDAIAAINVLETVEEVMAAAAAEREGKNRPSVLAAAQERIPDDADADTDADADSGTDVEES